MMEVAASVGSAVRGLFQATHPIKAKWERIKAPSLPRSSHSLSVIAGRAYIFGGEINPREPVDNDMHIITLPYDEVSEADYKKVPAKSEIAGGEVPEKRVGHTAAVIGERIFVYGGRGGKDMKPLEEKGRVWVYDTRSDAWTYLDPVPGTPVPETRSYHSSVAILKPEPSNMKGVKVNNVTEEPKVGTIAESAKTDEELGGYGTFFVHAGCPASGRTNDLWGFGVRSRTWKEFPTAPGKPRGGTALAVSKQRIYRYGGFNGQGEEGGYLDYLELGLDTFSDKSGVGEMSISAKGKWETLNFQEESMQFPGNRSVAGLQAISTGVGREYLVCFLGERDPSSEGHAGAGKFWGDVWTFQCPPQGMTAASFKDATWQALGRETGEGLWSVVQVADAEGVEGEDVHRLVPGERGWFPSSTMGDLDASGIVLWGGLNGKNEREDNGWILRIE
ncbi:hypothetical protein EG329_007719 [Mollisiaceae sp. DMI_Dod_QoI]|nr:hypothetical protein EG329_007719 [Helotiales sp. DMI_Dod_QoI]